MNHKQLECLVTMALYFTVAGVTLAIGTFGIRILNRIYG